jgi:hypothetical protein
MKESKKETAADRRSFLKLAGVGAAAGVTALVGGETAAQAGEASGKVSLYRETEHIKRYYELAR